MTHAQTNGIDEYTFLKDGAYFIRERHLAKMGVLPAVEPAPVADPDVRSQHSKRLTDLPTSPKAISVILMTHFLDCRFNVSFPEAHEGKTGDMKN